MQDYEIGIGILLLIMGVCHGKPVFKGTRILVSDVIELLGAGVSIEEIIRNYYPSLNDKMSGEVLQRNF